MKPQLVTPSGSIGVTAATVVSNSPSALHSIILTAAAAAATIIVYDSASAASGTVLASLTVLTGTSASVPFHCPLNCLKGITVAVTGVAATAFLSYSKEG